MRTLKNFYPQYGGQVAILAVGTDPTESVERIRSFQEAQGYSWPMAPAQLNIIKDYRVTVQSTKVGVDRNGVIRFREGYGTRHESWWEEVFSSLLQP